MDTTVTVAMPTVVRDGAVAADTTVVDVAPTTVAPDAAADAQDLVDTPDLPDMAAVVPHTRNTAVADTAVAADTGNTNANKNVSPEESPFGLRFLQRSGELRRLEACGVGERANGRPSGRRRKAAILLAWTP